MMAGEREERERRRAEEPRGLLERAIKSSSLCFTTRVA